MEMLCQNNLPLRDTPLVHAITNGITNEFVANSLLAIGAKPIMAEDKRELEAVIQVADGLFLNLGQMSPVKEESIRQATHLASAYGKPVVVDAVGITQLPNRLQLVKDLLSLSPQVVKGNISEMRGLLGLGSQARGVDVCQADQEFDSLEVLAQSLKEFSLQQPKTCFLATGSRDCLAFQGNIWWLENGVRALDQITGTGDVVGALITGLLAGGVDQFQACLQGVTYFNLCGERAWECYPNALASFRQELLNQVGHLSSEKWPLQAKIGEG